MQTFKVGDRVRVDRKGGRVSKNDIMWPPVMDKYQGIVTTVRSVTNDHSCRLLDCDWWNFDNIWLTKVGSNFKGNVK